MRRRLKRPLPFFHPSTSNLQISSEIERHSKQQAIFAGSLDSRAVFCSVSASYLHHYSSLTKEAMLTTQPPVDPPPLQRRLQHLHRRRAPTPPKHDGDPPPILHRHVATSRRIHPPPRHESQRHNCDILISRSRTRMDRLFICHYGFRALGLEHCMYCLDVLLGTG